MALVKFSTNHGDFTLDIDEVNAPKTAETFCSTSKTVTTTTRFFIV